MISLRINVPIYLNNIQFMTCHVQGDPDKTTLTQLKPTISVFMNVFIEMSANYGAKGGKLKFRRDQIFVSF